jgi:hypothetical protein
VATLKRPLDDVTTEEAGAAENEDVHAVVMGWSRTTFAR